MKLLVLAGGFGTRLASVVGDLPKSLAPIGDHPFLKLQIAHWIGQGLDSFTFLLHHRADDIINFLNTEKRGLLANCKVDWVVEKRPLDTGGSIANAVLECGLSSDFLVINADTWIGGGVTELIQASSPTIASVWVNDVGRYGELKFASDYRILAFNEKNGSFGGGWINAGICHLSPYFFAEWAGTPFSLERDFFPTLVSNNLLKALPLRVDFLDIGIPEDYKLFIEKYRSFSGTD